MAKAVFRIENRLGIAAPARVVWEVVSDLVRWPEWNRLYPDVAGKIAFGETLTLTEQLPGFEPETIQPTIVEWGPESHLHWRLSQSFGLLKRVRYFEIDPLSDEGCAFSNGEDWHGRPARYVPAARRRAMREAFEALGEAVRERSVLFWQAEQPAPTSAA